VMASYWKRWMVDGERYKGRRERESRYRRAW
jgi:hypothetical protein